jgi:hypothetical protein
VPTLTETVVREVPPANRFVTVTERSVVFERVWVTPRNADASPKITSWIPSLRMRKPNRRMTRRLMTACRSFLGSSRRSVTRFSSYHVVQERHGVPGRAGVEGPCGCGESCFGGGIRLPCRNLGGTSNGGGPSQTRSPAPQT